jgi:hypothetical protein
MGSKDNHKENVREYQFRDDLEKNGKEIKRAVTKQYEKKQQQKIERALKTNSVRDLLNIDVDGF